MSKNTTYRTLFDEDNTYLKSVTNSRTIQAQIADRARILLFKAAGKLNAFVAAGLGISINTVRRCVARFNQGGTDLALFDDEHSGRPIEITDDAKSWMIRVSCQKPSELGYEQELWTLSSLHKYIQNHAEEAGYHAFVLWINQRYKKC